MKMLDLSTEQVGTDDLCKMRSECDPVEGGGDPERIRDAYVDNLRERFSKDHIYVSVELSFTSFLFAIAFIEPIFTDR